tara:strand:- start:1792 stop:2154 length:363 start_codon:yes stop_codon:yes gene_type:complete
MKTFIQGKLARLNRLPNTLNGNPRFKGQIVTNDRELIEFFTVANDQFSYVIGSYVGAIGDWELIIQRGKTRVVGVTFANKTPINPYGDRGLESRSTPIRQLPQFAGWSDSQIVNYLESGV